MVDIKEQLKGGNAFFWSKLTEGYLLILYVI